MLKRNKIIIYKVSLIINMNNQYNNFNNNWNNTNMLKLNQNTQIYNNNFNNIKPNNNFNNSMNIQNNFNYNNNNMLNLQNNNNFNNNTTTQSTSTSLYHCPKCNNLIDKKLKDDHLLSHQIDEAEKSKNNHLPLYRENRYNRLIRNDINRLPRFHFNIQNPNNNNINNNTSIQNRPMNLFNINNNDLNNHNNPPLHIIIFTKKHSVNENPINFPEIIIQDINKLEEANRKCMICLEDFMSKEKVTALPCIHFFHTPCIKEWIKEKNECPVCKFELTQQNINRKIKYL